MMVTLRRLSGSICVILLLVCSGCKSAHQIKLEKQVTSLQSQLDDAHSQISNLKDKAETLEAASETLQQQIARFDSENWRDVVPDAEAASSDVDDAQSDLKSSVDEADDGN